MKSALVRRARSRYSSALDALSRSSRSSSDSTGSSSTSGVLPSSAMASLFLGLEFGVDDLLAALASGAGRGRLLRLRRGRLVELLREVLGRRLEIGDRPADLLRGVRVLGA